MFSTIKERGARIADQDILTPEEIREIALANGFKLKLQKDGEMDLNPYVYTFVRALIRKVKAK